MESSRKPLEMSRQLLTWVGVFASVENTGKLKKLIYFSLSLFIFLALLSVSVSSAVFYCTFMAVDLEGSLYALAQITAFSSATYVIIVTFFVRHELRSIFDSLYQICQTSKDFCKHEWCIKFIQSN